eukprot:2412653-Alexandrium_andersonii.AAC.1
MKSHRPPSALSTEHPGLRAPWIACRTQPDLVDWRTAKRLATPSRSFEVVPSPYWPSAAHE